MGITYRPVASKTLTRVSALGNLVVALVEVLKVIGEKGVRITPDIMASGGGAGDGGGATSARCCF